MREAAAFDLLSILLYIIATFTKQKTAGARLSVNISSLITACAANSYDVDYSKWGRYIDDLLIAENRSLICGKRLGNAPGSV
ncbi:hypothetical protein [Klebsiella pneumoniae]|uniref:hypothetical protein n=1 Tax=Klebsiella pneumoniae TaxID=573 RepID=UPI002949C780|nr:hypothetical protein [Klebsiella pneumoniae]MDV5550536.1 hypothetical protein [Klebsiella pneumoniae]